MRYSDLRDVLRNYVLDKERSELESLKDIGLALYMALCDVIDLKKEKKGDE